MRARIAGAVLVTALAGVAYVGEAEARITAAQAVAILKAVSDAQTLAERAKAQYDYCARNREVSLACFGDPALNFVRGIDRLEARLNATSRTQTPGSACRNRLSEMATEADDLSADLKRLTTAISPDLGPKWLRTLKQRFRGLLDGTRAAVALCRRP
jgi:hypothetical protein